MAASIEFVLAPDDEKQFLRVMEPYQLQAYPHRIPPDFEPFTASWNNAHKFTEDSYWLAAPQWGTINIRGIKRGPQQGFRELDELTSPVMLYDRSAFDENGELRSGKIWTELNVNGDRQLTNIFPDAYRKMWLVFRDHLKKMQSSSPAGYLVGAHAAKMYKAGTKLREYGRKGVLLAPYGGRG